MPPKKRDKPSLYYSRVFVRKETAALFDNILLHDKAQAEYPHKVKLLDIYAEAAALLAQQRGISV